MIVLMTPKLKLVDIALAFLGKVMLATTGEMVVVCMWQRKIETERERERGRERERERERKGERERERRQCPPLQH